MLVRPSLFSLQHLGVIDLSCQVYFTLIALIPVTWMMCVVSGSDEPKGLSWVGREDNMIVSMRNIRS